MQVLGCNQLQLATYLPQVICEVIAGAWGKKF